MNSGIYVIENKLDNKKYVGSAKNFYKRWERHKNDLSKNCHSSIKLQRAYNKYGKDNFRFYIIEKLNYEKTIILDRENFYISFFNSKDHGYNIADASFGDVLSNHPNKEHIKQKISKTLRKNISKLSEDERKEKFGKPGKLNGMYGKTHTPEARDKVSKAQKGNTHRLGHKVTKETKKKLSIIASKRIGDKNPFFGKTHSEETKKKISKANKGKIPANVKAVEYQGKKYNSIAEMARELDIKYTTAWHRVKKSK